MPETIILKTCYKCKQVKSLDEFYKDRRTKDGLYCYCKTCSDTYNKQYQHTEAFRKKRARITKRYRLKFPEKFKAHTILNHAIERKGFPKASLFSCSTKCGSRAQGYHHYLGYAPEHWFDVIPTCDTCHKSLDNQ